MFTHSIIKKGTMVKTIFFLVDVYANCHSKGIETNDIYTKKVNAHEVR